MLKIFRRVSSIVLLILVAAAPFGIGGILKLSEVMNQHYYSYADDYANNTVDQLQKDISAKEIELQTAPPEDAQSLKDELASLYREFYYNELERAVQRILLEFGQFPRKRYEPSVRRQSETQSA